MSETENKGRRIIVSPKTVTAELVANGSNIEILLSDALSIISSEIVNLKAKTMRPNGKLDLSEARVLTGYIKSLTDILKEQREQESERNLANMTDDEILNLMEALYKKRGLNAGPK